MFRNFATLLSAAGASLAALLGASNAQAVVYSVSNVPSPGSTLDLSPAKTYTHKLDFPGDGSSTAINGVQLSAVGTSGTDPLTGNGFNLSMANPANFFVGASPNAGVLQDFIHNGSQPAGSVETLTLSGLTPGTVYDARFYYRDFGTRPNTLTLNTGAGITVIGTVDELPSPTNESYVTIKYKTESTSAVFTFAQQLAGASWHQYAVTNEVAAGPSNTQIVQGLFNTGVNNAGFALTDNAVDPHWTLGGGNAIVATGAGGFPIGPWLGDTTVSGWVSPANDTNGGAGNFSYSTTFSTDAMGILSLAGRAAVDDTIVGFTVDGIAGSFLSSGFGSFAPFSFNGLLGTGLHTVQFIVNNGSFGPTGLRVEFTSALFTPIPEPASMSLMALALAGLAMRSRRQRA